jgi:hypothetical protein
MRHLSWLPLALVLYLASSVGAAPPKTFGTVVVTLDPMGEELAGWQLRADFGKGYAAIVGIEGGEHPAWAEPAHYDPRALNGGEIVLAALAADTELPTGPTVVAVIHVEHYVSGLPPLEISEVVAVGSDGNEIPVTVTQENGDLR